MNTTTNLGLKMPEYSDQADIQDINDNMETLDGKIGAVGNTSVQEQIDAVVEKIGSTVLPTTAQTLTGAIAEVDNIIEGYYYDGAFYEEETHTTQITPETEKLYVDLAEDCIYRWSGTEYIMVGGSGTATLLSGDDYEIAL